MTQDKFLESIQLKDYDKEKFIQLIINEPFFLDLAVDSMINHKKIMIYYHCYEVLKEAVKLKVTVFLKYKNNFIRLLSHSNSYHRDFGLTLLGQITSQCSEINFKEFSSAFLKCINDEKLMTSQCCLNSLNLIIKARPEYTDFILKYLLDPNNFQTYKQKAQELLYSDVIPCLMSAYQKGFQKTAIEAYLIARSKSSSPKTKKLAKQSLEIIQKKA
ncbi:MAG: hypothetical protein MJB14_00475 [Spirochaetes bacterium]|nr:hypothetical protein [Spirochaetota bacterium]